LDKKPVFLVMDYLLTGIVIALICLAAWMFYKRWTGRYREAPADAAPEEYVEPEKPEEVITAGAQPPASSEE
jgi:H+/gluconate symporter-like permease